MAALLRPARDDAFPRIRASFARVSPEDSPPARDADRYELVVVLRGAAVAALGRTEKELREGGAAFAPPGSARALRGAPGADRPAEAAVLAFDADWARDPARGGVVAALAARAAGPEPLRAAAADARSAERKLILAAAADEDGALRAAFAEAAFLELALSILGPASRDPAPGAPWWLRRACAAMESRRNLDGGGARLAELAGRSREHVIRQMRRYYGMTPTQFVNDVRLRKAKDLLVRSGATVMDVGYALGFQNPSYFARLFREKYGVPPSAFRDGRSS